jgi:rod shape-determining protein MreD
MPEFIRAQQGMTMKWVRAVLLVCFIAVIQAGLANAIAVTSLNIKPDLLLILLVFFAVSSTSRDAIVISFAIGFAADVIAIGQPMGPRTISFGVIGTMLAHIHNVLVIRKMSYTVVTVFFSGLLVFSISNLLTFLANRSAVTHAYTIVLGTSLYSSIAAPFLLLPAAWLMRIKTGSLNR